jgi:hypothetical protein
MHPKDAIDHTGFPEAQVGGKFNTPAMVRDITMLHISQ